MDYLNEQMGNFNRVVELTGMNENTRKNLSSLSVDVTHLGKELVTTNLGQ